jgi:hypothetical protein
MRDEGANLSLAHLAWVTLVVKEDVTLDPGDVGLLGAQTEVAHATYRTDFIEQQGH